MEKNSVNNNIIYILVGIIAILLIIILVLVSSSNNEVLTSKEKEYTKDTIVEENDNYSLFISKNSLVLEDKANKKQEKVLDIKKTENDYNSDFKMIIDEGKVKGIIYNYGCIGCYADGPIQISDEEESDKVYEHTGYVNLEDKKTYYDDEFVYIYQEDSKTYGIEYIEAFKLNDNELVDKVTTYELSNNDKEEIDNYYNKDQYKKEKTSKGTYFLKHYRGGTDSPEATYKVFDDKGQKLFEGVENYDFVISSKGILYYLDDTVYAVPYGESKEAFNFFNKVNSISKSSNNKNIYVTGEKDGSLVAYNLTNGKDYPLLVLDEGYYFTYALEPYRINTPYDVYVHIGYENQDYCGEVFFKENTSTKYYQSDCWGNEYTP